MKNKIHFAPKYFNNPTHPITITLIGVGGTGSFILTRLARIDYALRQLNHPGLFVVAFDNDKVEKYNVGRQNFGINDVGENKAMALINKINSNYGTYWKAMKENYTLNLKNPLTSNIFISCVDNAKFRNNFNKWFIKLKANTYLAEYKTPYYWLDLGNARKKAQFVLGSLKIEQPKSERFDVINKLDTIIQKFGDLLKFDTIEIQGNGCSYNAKLEEQSLFINDAISVSASDLIFELIHKKYINKHGAFLNMDNFKSNPILV